MSIHLEIAKNVQADKEKKYSRKLYSEPEARYKRDKQQLPVEAKI